MIPDSAKSRLHWDALDRRIPERLRALGEAKDVV
jgi:hypothetical protein